MIVEKSIKASLVTTTNESSVRKWWLYSFFLFLIFSVLVVLAIHFEDFFVIIQDCKLLPSLFANIFLYILLSFLIYWPIYHSAYKKNNLNLLATFIVLWPLKELWQMPETIYFDPFDWALFISLTCIKIFFWINCIRLYKVNYHKKKCAVKK